MTTVDFGAYRMAFNDGSAVDPVKNYEWGTQEAFRAILRPGDVCIDVGAHVGYFTCLAASLVGPKGHVVAFEPNPQNYRQLERNTDQFDNVSLKRMAVGATERTATFYTCQDNDGGHALWNPANSDGNPLSKVRSEYQSVRVVPLDDAVDGPVRLIKMDIEGGEVDAVRGADGIIENERPYVICEVNSFGLRQMGETEKGLRAMFQARGYHEYALQDIAPYWVPLRPNQTTGQPYRDVDGRLVMDVWNILMAPEPMP